MAIVKLPLTSLMSPELEVYKYQISRALFQYGLMNRHIDDYRILFYEGIRKITLFIDGPTLDGRYVENEIIITLGRDDIFLYSTLESKSRSI